MACSLKGHQLMDTLVQNAPPKDAGSASVPVKGKLLLVLGGWDGDNSLATSDYVCSSMEMHPSQYDQQTPPSSPYLVLITGHHHLHIMYFLQSLPPLTFEAEAVFGCATFNSPMHDNREVVLAVGGMRTKPLLKF